MKKLAAFCAALLIYAALMPSCSCRKQSRYTWHSEVMTDYFDTLITLVAYTKTQQEFETYFQ